MRAGASTWDWASPVGHVAVPAGLPSRAALPGLPCLEAFFGHRYRRFGGRHVVLRGALEDFANRLEDAVPLWHGLRGRPAEDFPAEVDKAAGVGDEVGRVCYAAIR